MLEGMAQPIDRETLALKAATHAYLWAGAVKFAASQLLVSDADESKLPPQARDLRSAARQSLALSLMLALRNVLRAAEMACRYADRAEKTNLLAALGRFKIRLPGLVDARGVLEHFDRYTDVGGSPTALYEVTFKRGDGTYVVSAGGVEIDVAVAIDESRHLSANVIGIAGDRWTYPVGNEVE